MSDPYLQFDFAHSKNPLPLCFSRPKKIITTHKIDEVIPAIQKVEEAVEDGCYAAGYLTYEAAGAFNPLLAVYRKGKMPYLWFGIFDEPSRSRKKEQKRSIFQVLKWQPMLDKQSYIESIQKIKEAIQHGETYQVNYTIPFRASFDGDDYAFYQQLRRAQNRGYHAYLDTGRFQILSASPELFFHWSGKQIMTRPMKGTQERGKSFTEDLKNERQLYHSEKDRSENAIAVDLLRNDLACIAEEGSIEVPALFEIEKYATVFQMTSTITAQVKSNTTFEQILTALLPCGSVTGAPKISTMKKISELEVSPREVYCGAIGYITPEKEAIFNVPIRTVIVDRLAKTADYRVGGGVTWDSSVEGEYEEALSKAMILKESFPSSFSLLESLRLKDGEWYLLERHLKRLQESAEYFDFRIPIGTIALKLKDYAERNSKGTYKVRLLVHRDGTIQIDKELLLNAEEKVYPVRLAARPISKEDRFLYHKTTNRKMLEVRKNDYSDVFDVLMWNEEGELTEFTIGNLVVELDGEKWTPTLSSGLLAGTFREELLANGEIRERVLTKKDLKKCTQIWLINSVRGWVPVKLLTESISL